MHRISISEHRFGWGLQIGKQLRKMYNMSSAFSMQSFIFTTNVGMRPAEPCTISVVATHQLLTQILLAVMRQVRSFADTTIFFNSRHEFLGTEDRSPQYHKAIITWSCTGNHFSNFLYRLILEDTRLPLVKHLFPKITSSSKKITGRVVAIPYTLRKLIALAASAVVVSVDDGN